MNKRALGVGFIIFLLTFSAAAALSVLKIRIIAEQANIRLSPDQSSGIMTMVPKGALLESSQKQGEWYVVTLPPDENGFIRQGYVHQGMVEVVDFGETTQTAPPPPPPTTAPAAQPAQYPPPPPVVASPKLFSGLTTKFGWLRSPDPGGIDKGWIVGFNYDIGLSRNFALGIEILPSYKNYSEIDLQVFPILGFVNLKAGLNLGDFMQPLGFISPYAGVGAGLEAVYAITSWEGESLTDFSTRGAFHIFTGLQLKLGSLKLIGEYQWIRVSDPNVDPNFWRHYLLFGFRFGR